jgi:lipoprotein NlpD
MSLQEIKDEFRTLRFGAGTALAALLLAACSSPTHRAPVEDRKPPARPAAAASAALAAAAAASSAVSGAPSAVADPQAPKPPLPGAENAGKPGYYTVKPGDTLIRVGLENGQSWRDIARWSSLDNPNIIEVGQVLRVVPPTAEASGVSVKPVMPTGHVETRPLDGRAAASAATAANAAPAAGPAPAPMREPDDGLSWGWPAAGSVLTAFDDASSRGLDISGKAGEPVLAAADGRVIYVGAGVRGLGNLVIIKHNATYLSAYAHNQTLLVKEDQAVRRGQKIAEMGSSDAERVQLHFEIRRLGKPVDPVRLLPAR